MSALPKISVITVCYNSAKTIEATLASVIKQNYPNLEYIIIDGGSTDQTLSIIARYKESLAKVVSEKDSGISNAFNKGLAVATGELICFLNSDDYFLDGALTKMVGRYLESGSNGDIVYGDAYLSFEGRPAVVIKALEKAEFNIFEAFICHQACLIKMALFKKLGDYDETFSIAMDYEWFLRCITHNSIFLPLKGTVVVNYSGNGASTKNMFGNFGEIVRAAKKNGIWGFQMWLFVNFKKFKIIVGLLLKLMNLEFLILFYQSRVSKKYREV